MLPSPAAEFQPNSFFVFDVDTSVNDKNRSQGLVGMKIKNSWKSQSALSLFSLHLWFISRNLQCLEFDCLSAILTLLTEFVLKLPQKPCALSAL